MTISSETMAQRNESGESVTLSRLEFDVLHFGITQKQLMTLQATGATFEGNDIAMDIRLYGKRLALSSVDKVVRINFGARIVFAIANDMEVRQFTFEK